MKFPFRIVIVVVGTLLIVGLMVGAVWPGSDHDVMIAEGTLVLALVTFWLVVVAFSEMRDGQNRAEESKRALFRPLLIPVGSLGLNQQSNEADFWDVNATHKVEVRNVGNGVATNVQAVILSRRDPTPWTSQVFSMWLSRPLAKHEELGGQFAIGKLLIPLRTQIIDVSLFAPKNTFYFFRLTLT